MFLRNYDNYLLAIMGATKSADASNTYIVSSHTGAEGSIDGGFVDGNICYKASTGTLKKITLTNSTDYSIYVPTMLQKGNICLGTGTAAVTYEDYKLSGTLIDNSKLTYLSQNLLFDNETKKYTKEVTFTYSNSTGKDITIGEWGMWTPSSYMYTSSNSYMTNEYALHYREVLAEPITIAAGTTATLTFSVTLPMPNHP